MELDKIRNLLYSYFMAQLDKILRGLEKRGFTKKYCHGSVVKLYPPQKELPFYTLHLGERAIHPLKRYAKINWGLDILFL